jgi:hypothetical protein
MLSMTVQQLRRFLDKVPAHYVIMIYAEDTKESYGGLDPLIDIMVDGDVNQVYLKRG